MNNPFKAFIVFVLCIILLASLGSCSTQTRGFNYSQHARSGQKHAKKVHKMNRGNDLVHFKAPCNRH